MAFTSSYDKLSFSTEASSLRGSKEGEVAFSELVGFRSEQK